MNEKKVTVSLAPLDSTDMHWARENRNKYEVWQWCRQVGWISDKEQFEWFERQHKDPTVKMFKIMAESEVAEGKPARGPVGVCGLTSIDWVNRRAEFSCWIDPQLQKRGLGRLALTLLLDHAFSRLGLNVVWGESFAGNPALKLFESLGFAVEGVRRQFYYREGQFIDAHLFSITAEEFHARSLARESGADPSGGGGGLLPPSEAAGAQAEGAVTRRPSRRRGVRKKRDGDEA